MNVSEMVKNVNSECHPATNIDAIIKRHLNRGQKVIASKGPKGGWFWLRQYGYTLTTSNGISDYALSPLVDISKVINFRDETNDQALGYLTDSQFRTVEPSPDGTGTGFLYTVRGFSPVQNQPSSASTLSFTSTSASDVTSYIINVQGLNASSVLVYETVTLTGATPVVTTNSYTKIFALSKNIATNGIVTCTSNSGGVTNVVIPRKERHISHPVVFVYDVPSATGTLYYDFTMKLPDIVDDNDISLIPEQYHDAIETYAKFQTYKHLNNPTMAGIVAQEFDKRIVDMLQDTNKPQGLWTMNEIDVDLDAFGGRYPSNYPAE